MDTVELEETREKVRGVADVVDKGFVARESWLERGDELADAGLGWRWGGNAGAGVRYLRGREICLYIEFTTLLKCTGREGTLAPSPRHNAVIFEGNQIIFPQLTTTT